MSEISQTFHTHQEWFNNASVWLTRHPQYSPCQFRATCYDTLGRVCSIGKDFRIAQEEGTFPIRWVWPDQVARFMVST